MTFDDQNTPETLRSSTDDVYALARRISDYTPEEIYGPAGSGPIAESPGGLPELPMAELPWNDPIEVEPSAVPIVHRPGRARLLTGIAAAVALVVLVAGLLFANMINRRQDAPVGPVEPGPSATSSSPQSTTSSAPAADPFGGSDSAGRAAAVTACTKAYGSWTKESLGSSPALSGFTIKAATTGVDAKGTRVTTAVMTNGKTRLVCNTKPSNGLREPIKDNVSSATSTKVFAFSQSDTENYGLGAQDLVWAGGRLPASVVGLSYTWPDKHVAEASVSKDGYWVMQYLAPKLFTTESYNDLASVVVRLRLADGGTRVLKFGWDIDTSCAAVNLGGC